MKKRCVLLILDGLGIAEDRSRSAVDAAGMGFFRSLESEYGSIGLEASGEVVGLPVGQMGNSEVGHLTIGSGRSIEQSLELINKSIEGGKFFNNSKLLRLISLALEGGNKIHLIGLISDGGIHAHVNHLIAICRLLLENNFSAFGIHVFTDGRDAPVRSARFFFEKLEREVSDFSSHLCSIAGRYYGMDRDNRRERTVMSVDAIMNVDGCKEFSSWRECIDFNYINGLDDEFFEPARILSGESVKGIDRGDIILCFNFRSDRMRQLLEVLADRCELGLDFFSNNIYTFTDYGIGLKSSQVIFENEEIINTLSEVISCNGLSQLKLTETEKYPHVTFFFSGGREEAFELETRVMCNSPRCATYDLEPAMSAYAITDELLSQIRSKKFDFICVNFANLDMVGHTGNFAATVSACEVVDNCLSVIVPELLSFDYTIVITSDHGNAEQMFYENGEICTTHSVNKVPLILVTGDKSLKLECKERSLIDIAPTILKILGLEIPREMTGSPLF